MACHGELKSKNDSCHSHSQRFDWLLWGSLGIVGVSYALHLIAPPLPELASSFTHASFDLMNKMWWGVLLGILFVGILGRVPREFVMKLLGKGGSLLGIVRACMGGVLLDLCSHGILLVGMKLYERGASLGQVMAFLIASPWNSFSLTLIMFALMGLKWTLVFMGLSMLVAIVSGLIFEALVKRKVLPSNPNEGDLPEDFKFWPAAKAGLQSVHWSPSLIASMLKEGAKESKMVLRWVFLGVVLAAGIRAGVPTEQFATFFGATLGGLGLTIVAATVIEVCSEGSTPIAADLLSRAKAPGNSFAFLMTGVSTDYTEIMGIKETMKSWKVALFLPLVTVPQIVLLGWMLNNV